MIVCFDIGGTAIKPARAEAMDSITPLGRLPTPSADFAAFVATLRDAIAGTGSTPERVALSICGVVDVETRRIKCANIPCIDGRPLEAELEDALGLPVMIANDADCFALAEAHAGAGRGHDIVFGIILGSGVGGGLVANGRLVNAKGGFAGEWGHGPIVSPIVGNPPVMIEPFACGCGQRGCVDTVGGARGLERVHAALHQETASSETILAGWIAGDAKAARTVAIQVEMVSGPLAVAVNLTGASIVPVGGGLSNVPELIAALDTAVRARILRRFDRPLVVPALCRPEPGLVGAAILALSAGEAEP